jgi:hypothetical protein
MEVSVQLDVADASVQLERRLHAKIGEERRKEFLNKRRLRKL